MPQLRYGNGDLAPVISGETLNFHYGKHLQTYVNNLNNLIVGTEFENASLEEIAAKAQGGIGNNAGQVLNHALYFEQFAPSPSKKAPSGALADAIIQSFGSFDEMKSKMNSAASTLFGSGWAWLCADANGALSIQQMTNADNPLRHNQKPILTFDVWEHAYYLDYQNRRADYIAALWNIIDWNIVESRF
ncbi:MAG: superoxide dismutase [Paludibacteraceae bacterium]|nr:superoxide dismutase [Paludibacteraceae bacterium]